MSSPYPSHLLVMKWLKTMIMFELSTAASEMLHDSTSSRCAKFIRASDGITLSSVGERSRFTYGRCTIR